MLCRRSADLFPIDDSEATRSLAEHESAEAEDMQLARRQWRFLKMALILEEDDAD